MRWRYSKYSVTRGLQRLKTKTAILISAAGLVLGSGAGLAFATFGSAHAATPATVWKLNAPSSITFSCGGGDYVHTLNTVSEDLSTGYFSGTGSYNADTSYTWTVNGNITGNNIAFKVVYNGSNAGYTLNGTGTIASTGSIAGNVDNNCQTFSMPEGSATAVTVPGGRNSINVSFFNGGSGNAHWSRDMSVDSSDPFSIVLSVPDNSSYAGINLHRAGSTLPASAPSFQYYESGNPSGGAPRLVIASTDGCYAVEYAYPAVNKQWNTASQWDLMGSCGYQYNAGWTGVQAAFAGKTIASVYIVSDSYTGSHTEWVDNIQYGGQTISQPSDNANSH